MLRFDRRLLWSLGLLLLSSLAAAADIEVETPCLRLLPGDLPAAGYFSLSNTGDESAALVGADSATFGRVRMHQSIQEKGVASMEPVPRLELAPGETVEFAPGGYHLMLMERGQPLALGDEVTVTLKFDDGRRTPVVFRAVSPASL
ncbi:hypothetical protein DFO67_1303 [Modicisalibacter xianhensis]|uniref:Copper(I)-binding protein n=1 Tax=Modicisalibacter xianhensis TaxID=442341 RepID=A0A4V3GSB1_9GAMM|nr:copper chaperone PCu(A)C [Halomonas xianhensis]TDX22193.1 hypothetical protein DFO67_1303 [Halomonas xianhensis]